MVSISSLWVFLPAEVWNESSWMRTIWDGKISLKGTRKLWATSTRMWLHRSHALVALWIKPRTGWQVDPKWSFGKWTVALPKDIEGKPYKFKMLLFWILVRNTKWVLAFHFREISWSLGGFLKHYTDTLLLLTAFLNIWILSMLVFQNKWLKLIGYEPWIVDLCFHVRYTFSICALSKWSRHTSFSKRHTRSWSTRAMGIRKCPSDFMLLCANLEVLHSPWCAVFECASPFQKLSYVLPRIEIGTATSSSPFFTKLGCLLQH